MSQYWSAVVHGLTPYVPGEQPKMSQLVKLNTNEHPDGPSPKVLEAIRAATDDGLRLYPDPNADALTPAGRTHWGTIMGIVTALLIGTAVMMSSLAFSFQRYFEYQIEAAKAISQ